MDESYDVVIVGGSIAGLECAKNLVGSELKILLLEKEKEIGKKVCSAGVTCQDLKYIDKKFLTFPLKKLIINYQNQKIFFPKKSGIISSINREIFLNSRWIYLKKQRNVVLQNNVSVEKIISNHLLLTSDLRKIKFNYLVGADGANSLVRKYLKIPSEKVSFAIQYCLPRKFSNFEIFFDDKIFGNGYAWIFPNNSFTSIGCGCSTKVLTPPQLTKNFSLWLKKRKIDVSQLELQGGIFNADFRKYRFGNVFLVGDAAGLTCGITGKGMFAAFSSAEQVAGEILGKKSSENLIDNRLKQKNYLEKFQKYLENPLTRKTIYKLAMKLCKKKKFEEIALRFL